MRRSFLILASAFLLFACESDSDATGPGGEAPLAMTVDASEDWSLVALEAGTEVSASAPAASAAWDLGFFATSVMLNGGAAGPAGVVGHCLCQNASAPDASVVAMTPESALAAFEAVTEAAVPSDEEAWVSDALAPAIEAWYAYDPVQHTVAAAPERVWKVRTASGEAFAKLHVVAIEEASQEHAGRVTLEYALQPSAGAAFEDTRSLTVDVSAGSVHVDLESGASVAATEGWDLLLEGWDIRVNGGVSGTGSAGASLADLSFEEIADAGDLTASHYRGDAFGGVFDSHPWYRYNLQDNHQVWPTYDVYLVRRGEAVYKVQITGYYGPTGDSRQITFRYGRLR